MGWRLISPIASRTQIGNWCPEHPSVTLIPTLKIKHVSDTIETTIKQIMNKKFAIFDLSRHFVGIAPIGRQPSFAKAVAAAKADTAQT